MATSAPPPALLQGADAWRNALAKFALLFFGIALWHKGLSFYAYYLLPIAWVLDGALSRFRQTTKEPLVVALLVLCLVLALGILWSDDPKAGLKVWRRYFAFLVFIPYFSLLTKARLPWAIFGLLTGYFGAVAAGIYQLLIVGEQGIPPLGMPYLHFSSVLGIGALVTLYLAGVSGNKKAKLALWLLAIILLFLQFSQSARGILIATIASAAILLFLLYKREIKTFLGMMALLAAAVSVFAYNSSNFQQRLAQAKDDIELSRAGNYGSSVGYRLALWDIGLHGIAERPLLGHGTGMAINYFEKNVETYKGGIYKNLREFHDDILHYHNDWIEIGMHLGALGLAAYAYLLWSWYKTFSLHRMASLGAALVCFIFLCGVTDNLVFFRQTFYLLLVLTAIGIAWQKWNNMPSLGPAPPP
ncbi:O-antigen ligase [Nitrosospira sp. Nsp14]|uniref:O-antigen ligase family protein n=1 Tax=Nitrosospira sp. Nsp14 TaxID=1855333 RepID=UPI0008E31F55|nr:O-antigen ligase family protein [Nitrosospira sp. Nsp14]SFH54277.1 O-antigen ligase [Nitrosospira sp. Nsp14]